jgi:hypothetical protein
MIQEPKDENRYYRYLKYRIDTVETVTIKWDVSIRNSGDNFLMTSSTCDDKALALLSANSAEVVLGNLLTSADSNDSSKDQIFKDRKIGIETCLKISNFKIR